MKLSAKVFSFILLCLGLWSVYSKLGFKFNVDFLIPAILLIGGFILAHVDNKTYYEDRTRKCKNDKLF